MGSKRLYTLLFCLAICTSAFSQFSAGIETTFSNGYSSLIGARGIGGSIRYEATIKNNFRWTCSIGYVSFFDLGNLEFLTGRSIATLSNGLKYYFSETDKGLYAAADIGMARGRSIFSPGIGYRVNQWDITTRYNAIEDANYLSLRVAYVFRPK